jgi:multimeric flavodoxin WrbA
MAMETSDTKKVLVVMGSPREGNTFQASEIIREKLQKDRPIEFEYLWLRDMNLLPCKGCLACCCFGEEKCPNHDDAPLIERKMLESDCVIFALPVYVMNVPGLMKNFLERFGYLGHRQRFFAKKALVLVNTASGGLKSVMKYMNTIIRVWGFEVVGSVGLLTPPDPTSANPSRLNQGAAEQRLSKASAAILKSFDSDRRSPALYETAFFHVWRALAPMLERYYPFDYSYWKEKGWFLPGKKYFVDVPVNPLYVALGKFYGWVSARNYQRTLRAGLPSIR